MAITGDQLRMARAALKLTVRDVAEATGIDKSTIIRAEAGGRAYYQTVMKLQESLEQSGVEFLDPIEGVAGPGVRLKWGVEIAARAGGAASGEDGAAGGEIKALDQGMADYWAARPEQWSKMSEGGRQTISAEMFGDPHIADEVFAQRAVLHAAQ